MKTNNDGYKEIIDFLDAYNECFYEKDIEKLKKFYDTKNNRLIYFDNHKNNDTYDLEQHLPSYLRELRSTTAAAAKPSAAPAGYG
ncbi:MAG: hypothetical protein WBK20_04325 [Spirochaetota bacterium]